MTQSRRMLVLRAVVEDYIRSQEPVGSTTLTRDHDLGVSSATVRNDMAALEDEGYLIQPHTSAGRVPTEKGYRYFVDRLATVVPLSEAQRRGINSFLSGSVSLKDALQRSARLLSEITGQVAVVASPIAWPRHIAARGDGARCHDHVARGGDYRHRPRGPARPDHRIHARRGRDQPALQHRQRAMRRAVPIEIRGDRAIHRRQRRLRVGARRGRRAGRRLRIDGIGRNARTNCTCPAPRTWPTPGPWPIWPRSSTRWKNRSC